MSSLVLMEDTMKWTHSFERGKNQTPSFLLLWTVSPGHQRVWYGEIPLTEVCQLVNAKGMIDLEYHNFRNPLSIDGFKQWSLPYHQCHHQHHEKRELDIIVPPDGSAQHHLWSVFSKRIKKGKPDQVFRSNKFTDSSGEEEYIKYRHSNTIGKIRWGRILKGKWPNFFSNNKSNKDCEGGKEEGRKEGKEGRGKCKRNL